MSVISAIYEGGVFRPLDPVSLPEHCRVTFEPLETAPVEGEEENEAAPPAYLKAIYEIMGRSYDCGEIDLAARHNEHQP